MGSLVDRAVSVALRQDELLVIRRHKQGVDYCVLPGGGVEDGESPQDASLRELLEETGLSGTVERHLWTIKHADRVAHYYLVQVEPGPLVLGDPEATCRSDRNRYTPAWIPVGEIDEQNLRPESVRELLHSIDREGWVR